MTGTFTTRVNRIALAIALALFALLGILWWRDRTRAYEAPSWPHAAMAAIAPPADVIASERWIVAVNPECATCRARLADLRRELAAATADVTLGVLLVDVARRPGAYDPGEGLDAGVWWDSLGAWRERWGHRLYGETMVFGRDGALLRTLAPTGEALPGR